MTEIPDHLLQRTRSRRQALGLPVGDAGAGDAAGAPPAPAAGAAVPATVAAGGPALPRGPVAPAGRAAATPPPPKPPPHYVEAYRKRRKIPVWAMPAVLALPLWAVLYAGTLTAPPSNEVTLLAEGTATYSNCSACHGATGGGGAGPQLSDGAVLGTFPDPVDQVKWIITGSAGAEGGVYGVNNKPSVGGMPAFGGTLTLEQIVSVVMHERIDLSGEVLADVAEQWGDLGRLIEDPAVADAGATLPEEEVTAILARMGEENGLTIGAGE